LAQVLDDSTLHKWLDIYDGISSLDLSQKRIPPANGEVRFAEILQFLQFMPQGDGPGPELTHILTNPHFSKLMICHDLIAAQIYQQPNLRLYPPGPGSSGSVSKTTIDINPGFFWVDTLGQIVVYFGYTGGVAYKDWPENIFFV